MARKHDRRTEREERRDGRRRNRRELGQNFLKDGRTARRIVAASGAGGDDLVVEIGAGGGMLTRELARVARRIIAVEYDPYWAARLGERFSGHENVRVVRADALRTELPDEPFTVVANVPFGATTAILHRLLDEPAAPLRSAHLIVQKPVALKHARPAPTTLKTLTWSPWYEFAAGFELSAEAFRPRPRVDACLLVAAKRGPPLVDARHRHLFRALVRRAFEGPGRGRGQDLEALLHQDPTPQARKRRRLLPQLAPLRAHGPPVGGRLPVHDPRGPATPLALAAGPVRGETR